MINDLQDLLLAVNSGKIPLECFKPVLANMKKEKVLEVHSHQITPPHGDTEYWFTRITEEDTRKRKSIRSKTEEGLYEKLYQHYFREEKDSLEEVHRLWAADREVQGLAPGTLIRDEQRWVRYFADTPLSARNIAEIDNFEIERHIYGLIEKFEFKPKELVELKRILKAVFKWAIRHRIIDHNPMDEVEVNKSGCAPAVNKNDRGRIYLKDEQSAMLEETQRELWRCPQSTAAYGIQLQFHLGLRIGELVALRQSDVDTDEKTIHIQRMETRDRSGRPTIVNHTKKKSPDGNRILPLSDADLDVIDKILQTNEEYGYKDEDYLFISEVSGTRIHISGFDKRIRKLCKNVGIIPAKSCHDIRRTVASVLYRNTGSIEIVRRYMGHSDIETTWGYIYDIDSEEESRRLIVEALADRGKKDRNCPSVPRIGSSVPLSDERKNLTNPVNKRICEAF